MTRRLTTLLLLATLLVTSWVLPGPALGTDPPADGSVTTSSGRTLPPLPAELNEPSIHAEMLREEGAGDFTFAPGGEPTVILDARGMPGLAPEVEAATDGEVDGSVGTLSEPLTAAGLPNGLRKEVFGFLPYWMLTDSALSHMNYSLVSSIAYFSVGLRSDGYLAKGTSTGWTGWNSSQMTQVIDRAHANGVKVVLTVTHMAWNGDYAAMTTLLTSSTYRNRAVAQIVDAVRSRGADGVNLDFEPVPSSLRSHYTAFVKQLKSGLSGAGVGDFLTVCVMAGAATWATGYDVAGLTSAGAADALFVMGYDYHWSGSSRAGGVAPITSPYTIDVDGTMRDFLAETSGNKLIWGVPYYGRTWPTSSGQLNSTTRSGGSKAYTYTGHLSQAQQYGRRWDDVGKVPWYRWTDSSGNWSQGYYDDVESLGIKYDLVNSRGLAGTGMWTLLMDAGRDELWRLLASKFVNDTAPPVGGITLLPQTTSSQSVKVSWRVVDHASGVDRYKVQVRKVGGSWTTWLSGTKATSAWFTGKVDATYDFRVQAIDWKGNAQAWVTLPGKPGSVMPGAFARIATATLNIRSGAGTGYAIVDTASAGDAVYVLEGPVSASGYQWYRVQYGFSEWPSADYARIGWMAAGSSTEPYLVPSDPPTRTTLSPFVRDLVAPSAFSPNGDGVKDGLKASFSLRGAASSVKLDILNSSGGVVRSIDLGSRGAGSHSVTWDGRMNSGAVAPEGRYLPRVTATDGSGTHYAPAASLDASLLQTFGVDLDVTPPRLTGQDPAPGAELVAATRPVTLTFSEPMYSVGSASIYLKTATGTKILARNNVQSGRKQLVLVPDDPLAVRSKVTVWVSSRGRDAAGNRLSATSWTFRTAPGKTYDPARQFIVEPGGHTAYLIGADGSLSSAVSRSFSSRSGAKVGQRSKMPNLPGRWLYVENGVFANRWIRESALDHLLGQTERRKWDTSTRIVFRAGTHVGYRFDSSGNVTGTKSFRLGSRSSANVKGRVIVNGVPYLQVVNGVWAGYVVPESEHVHRPGRIERIRFPATPRITFAAGTYTGYRYDSSGNVTASVTATLSRASGAHASAWAVINGRPHFLVADGIWAGKWVRETAGIKVAA
ncbi:MAG TPA: glycosyl hydrolase family 18 protein [Candidatus Limnocylindria bacterium]